GTRSRGGGSLGRQSLDVRLDAGLLRPDALPIPDSLVAFVPGTGPADGVEASFGAPCSTALGIPGGRRRARGSPAERLSRLRSPGSLRRFRLPAHLGAD